MLIVRVLIFYILFINCEIYGANVQIKLEGLNSDVAENVRVKLSGIQYTNINIDQYFQNSILDAIHSGLRPLGYYSSKINFFLYRSSHQREDYTLFVRITLGNPIKISNINIISNGDICHDDDYKKLLSETKLFIGKILNHNEYDNFKNKLLNLSLSKGYFDAKFYKSELLISPLDYQSFWNISFDSGTRYFFGETTFYGGFLKKEYLKNVFHIKSGTYYDNKLLIEFNRRLFATNWFNSVVISQNFFSKSNTKRVPVNVFLVPSVANSFKMSIGYSSDVFGHLKIFWKRPCLNVYGHSFENIFGISILEQFIDLNYKIPLKCCPLYEYYLLQSGIKHHNIYNNQCNLMIKMDISRHWDSITGWKRSVYLHWCYDYSHRLKDVKPMMLVYPGISAHRILQRGGMMPSRGFSQYYSVDISNTLWKSYIDFLFLQSKNTWIRTVFCKHRLIIRNSCRWLVSNDFQSMLPLLQNFFFMSDSFIRGYNYQFSFFRNILLHQLAPSQKLIISSLEYQYNVFGKWWSASFIDSGEFFKNVRNGICWRCGTGVGLRWQSPIGPVKLDIAVPLCNRESNIFKLFHVYVGLGSEL